MGRAYSKRATNMKPQDVIKQLIGECDSWDQLDTLAFTFNEPSKFPTADCAFVDLEKGTLAVRWFGDGEKEDEVIKEKIYAIKATLEPYENLTKTVSLEAMNDNRNPRR